MDSEEPEEIWDEYAWERFLQQQDQKTERYMQLLERYIDHPNRDQIIAREMGWSHLLGEGGKDWASELDAEAEAGMEAAENGEGEETDTFEMHPLYRDSFGFTIWLEQLFEELGPGVQNHPAAVKLNTQTAIASAKLAAALTDDDVDELGMTIAYLKRALKAVTNGLDAAVQLQAEERLDPSRFEMVNQRLFHIRDGIITLMGEFRSEWRRRFGDR